MKLLILTQKVDINDDLLGFMHGWIAEFAKHCENVTVICLQKGEYELPNNVKVLSLGKEKHFNSECDDSMRLFHCSIVPLLYCLRFYKYIWQERKNYDSVFVHMNKEYVLLGGLFWRIWKKKILLWYNHRYGNKFVIAAIKLADAVFYTSPFSFAAKFSKARQMPAGIDVNLFRRDKSVEKIKNSLLFLGRISPVKKVDVLIGAAKLLEKRNMDFVLSIAGEAGEKDAEYFNEIKEQAGGLCQRQKVKFFGKLPNYKTPKLYNQNEIFINLTDSGSLDKTTLEAMSCEGMVIVCNKFFEKIFPPEWHDLLIFKEKNEKDLAEKIIGLINLNKTRKEEMGKKSREIIIENHNLKKLVKNIVENYDKC